MFKPIYYKSNVFYITVSTKALFSVDMKDFNRLDNLKPLMAYTDKFTF